jgi:hypothetical protein
MRRILVYAHHLLYVMSSNYDNAPQAPTLLWRAATAPKFQTRYLSRSTCPDRRDGNCNIDLGPFLLPLYPSMEAGKLPRLQPHDVNFPNMHGLMRLFSTSSPSSLTAVDGGTVQERRNLPIIAKATFSSRPRNAWTFLSDTTYGWCRAFKFFPRFYMVLILQEPAILL